jgi:hypothetical protein
MAFFLSTLRETIEQSAMRLTKWTILAVAVAVLAASLASHKSGAPKHPADIVVAQSPEIRPAIPVEPEIRKAIAVQTEASEVVGAQQIPQCRGSAMPLAQEIPKR